MHFHKKTLQIFIISCLLATLVSSCAGETATPVFFPTYDPFLPINQNTPVTPGFPTITQTNTPQPPTATREPTPTRIPLTVSPIVIGEGDRVLTTPTPDAERILPTPRQDADQYVVQAGDTLGSIAFQYGISVDSF